MGLTQSSRQRWLPHKPLFKQQRQPEGRPFQLMIMSPDLGTAFAYQGLKWENIYQLFEQGERFLDAVLYVEYIVPQSSLNKPDAFEFKLLLEKETGRLINTLNLISKK